METNQTEVVDQVPDVGTIIDAGIARREAERLALRGGITNAQKYNAVVAIAAGVVAKTLSETGRTPLTDAIFEDAGFKPTTDTRMDALKRGRQMYADSAELLRQAHLAGEARVDRDTRRAISIAKAELDQIITDPKCNLDAILAGVVALRRATGHAHPVEAVTFETAVEVFVQYRAGLS